MTAYARHLFLAALLGLVTPLGAEEDAKEAEKYAKLVAGLRPQEGSITIGGGIAVVNVPIGFSYFDQKDTQTILTDIWGNPPDKDVLGAIVPRGFDPRSVKSWLVTISYDDSGYVTDEDADHIDYTSMLKEMQEGALAANEERKKEGYPTVELVGWAAQPRYDKEGRKLHWAKELEFASDPEHTLNYNIRVLGRRGVLVLNAIAGMNQMPEIQKEMPQVIQMVNFNEGHRYVDFDPKVDKLAGYGLAALVAGGVAAKTGLFKTILVALLAGKKFVIAGAIGLWALIAKILKSRRS